MRAARDRCGNPNFTTEHACYEVFQPDAELGARCTFASECKPVGDQYPSCLPPAPGAESVCTIVGAPVRVGAGERCGHTCPSPQEGDSCYPIWGSEGACYRSDGLYCSQLTGSCAVFGNEGDWCTLAQYPSSCRDDLDCKTACDPETGECVSTGTCARRTAPGEACNPYDDDACADQGRCLTVDCPTSVSDHDGVSSCRDVCVVPGNEGEPCADTPFDGFACAYPFFCARETRTCERPRQWGEACEGSASCDFGLFCDSGERRCRTPRSVGEPCSESQQCATYRCSADPYDDARSALATSVTEGTCLDLPRTSEWDCSGSHGPEPTPVGSALRRAWR